MAVGRETSRFGQGPMAESYEDIRSVRTQNLMYVRRARRRLETWVVRAEIRKNEESFFAIVDPSCFRAGNIFESLFYGNKDGVVANERFSHLCRGVEQIVEEIEVVQIGSQERLQHGVVEQFIDFLVPQGAGETLAVVESFPQMRLAQRVVERIVDVLVLYTQGRFPVQLDP